MHASIFIQPARFGKRSGGYAMDAPMPVSRKVSQNHLSWKFCFTQLSELVGKMAIS